MPNLPKRSDERHGHRTKAEQASVSKAPSGAKIRWPRADPKWHRVAKNFYSSLKVSGQKVYYEQSDVDFAYYLCEAMTKNLTDGKFSSMLFSSIMDGMDRLLATEKARRLARVELQKVQEEDTESLAELHVLESYDSALEA